MRDGLHQVGLAESRVAVEKQRVVEFARSLRCSNRSRGGQFVALSDDEMFEGVTLGERREIRVWHRGDAHGRVERSDEQVHLRLRACGLVHNELYLQWMAKRDGRKTREQAGVF